VSVAEILVDAVQLFTSLTVTVYVPVVSILNVALCDPSADHVKTSAGVEGVAVAVTGTVTPHPQALNGTRESSVTTGD
jgi:hypothetical protein